jgi:signal transduction histidine kinase
MRRSAAVSSLISSMTTAEPDLGIESAARTRLPNRERVKLSQDIAAGIAHELRNPVFAIASAAQLLRYRITDDPVVEKNIGRVLREAERLNALVSALLDYGRPPAVQLTPHDPDHIWSEVLVSHRGQLESRALLVHHTPCHPRVACAIDVEQFTQACANVLGNAIDAAPEGSDLTIVSTSTPDGGWQSRLHNGGAAIAPDLLSNAFEPLVTNKPGHAGVGLAVAYRILSDHGGSVALHSNDNIGTTLTFLLPAARLP